MPDFEVILLLCTNLRFEFCIVSCDLQLLSFHDYCEFLVHIFHDQRMIHVALNL